MGVIIMSVLVSEIAIVSEFILITKTKRRFNSIRDNFLIFKYMETFGHKG